MKKTVRVFLFLFISVWVGSGMGEAATIRIGTPKIELELSPGEVYTGEIVTENPSSDAVDTKLYLEDWQYNEGGSGEKTFFPAGSDTRSASSWIAFAPTAQTIEAYGRLVVRYTISVPQEASGGYFSVLFIETMFQGAKDDEGVNVLVAGRIGALFFVHIKDKVRLEGEIVSVKLINSEGNRPLEIETTFKNTGDVEVVLGGNFLILDKEGRVVGRGDLDKMYTFPGMQAVRRTQWVGKLDSGEYDVLLTYDLGKGKSLVEEKTLTIP